jgi:hypothetical protein
MTPLRGHPRDLYRVYDEDEFLDGTVGAEFFEPAAPRRSERRLHRLAGAAMLAGAVGTAGGVIALNGLPRLGGTGIKAREILRPAAGPHFARQPISAQISSPPARMPTSLGPRRPGGHVDRAGRLRALAARGQVVVKRRGVPPRQVIVERAGVRGLVARSAADIRSTPDARLVADTRLVAAAQPVALVRSAAVARSVSSASSPRPRPEHVEFGFER